MGYFHKITNGVREVGDEYWVLASAIVGRLKREAGNKELLDKLERTMRKLEGQLVKEESIQL
jgi:hypothetical protein